jgi:quinol-cytochrome oxidoreductase complex cytochrome b subunit
MDWELGQKADPLAPAYPGIKPEWYFLWEYQLLKEFPAAPLWPGRARKFASCHWDLVRDLGCYPMARSTRLSRSIIAGLQ